MRGALHAKEPPEETNGIIPAYAGSTDGGPVDEAILEDHPRVCGEHLTAIDPALWPAGSSPRMRGAQPMNHGQMHMDGIIPAYAGSTC